MKRAAKSTTRALGGQRPARWLHRVTDLVLPPRCAVCEWPLDGLKEPLICQRCEGELVQSIDSSCPTCGGQRNEPAPVDQRCARCRGTKLPFHRAIALGDYQHQLRAVVISMKHRGHECLAIQMGHLLGRRIRKIAQCWQLDGIAPIPIHWTRLASRGANVAELLAEGISRQTGLPVRRALLRCNRATRKQGTLSTPQRLANVRGAFELGRARSLQDQRILLVDDVMTSCATISEAARKLRRAGASVDVAVVARGGGAT